MGYKMLLGEKYRMEVHWTKVTYDIEQVATLEGCYFSGPVLGDVLQLQQVDYIDLDFARQYVIFVDSYYIVRLSWDGVEHTTEKINLSNVTLNNKNLNVIPKLNDDDYITIDTKSHEDEAHLYNLVYPSYLISSDGTLYDFGSMK